MLNALIGFHFKVDTFSTGAVPKRDLNMRLQSFVELSSSPRRCQSRLDVLAPYLKKGTVGAELGVFKGGFLDYLLSTQPKLLYAVDPWYRIGMEWKWAMGEKSTLRALMRILDAFTEEISSGMLEPRIEFSQDFLAHIPDSSLDWVYIDTTHMYEQTLCELELSTKKVKSGGFIMGDDFISDETHMHHGVYKAVMQFVEAKRLTLLLDGTQNQFVCANIV